MMMHANSRCGSTPTRWRHILATLAIAAVLAGCASNPPEKFADSDAKTDVSVTLFKSAQESRARGDLAGAASLYRHAHGADPQKTAPLVGLGQVLAASGAPKDAA